MEENKDLKPSSKSSIIDSSANINKDSFGFSKKNRKLIFIFFIVITILSILITGKIYIKGNSTSLPTVKKIVPNTIPEITMPPDLPQLSSDSASLERISTTKVTEEEQLVIVSAETELKGTRYIGKITDGQAFPVDEKDRQEFEEKLKKWKENPKTNQTLFLFEARSIDDKILFEIPISVPPLGAGYGGLTGHGEPDSHLKTGFASEIFILPVKTNSIALRKRGGSILDRIYFEEWEPDIKFYYSIPKKIKSSDKITIKGQLVPADKYFKVTLYIKNLDNKEEYLVFVSPSENFASNFSKDINFLNQFLTKSGKYQILARASTPFRVKTLKSKPFVIEISSEGIPVEISGKDKPTRTSGEQAYISWDFIFSWFDMKELCSKGRCFNLTWSSNNVELIGGLGEYVCQNGRCSRPKGSNLNFKESVYTDTRTLRCVFGGVGEQSILLEVSENGKKIGEDIYKFNVNGKEKENTSCSVVDY